MANQPGGLIDDAAAAYGSSISDLAAHAHLAHTHLLELHSQFVPHAAIPPPPYTATITTGFAWARRPGEGFAYAIRVDVSVGGDGHAEQPFWTCSAAHDVTYTVESPDNYTDDDAIAFGMTNGTIAAWPYLREVVQSTSVRSGLAPVVLDVIRPTPIQAAGGA